MPGIYDIYTYEDLPGKNIFGNIIADEPFLAEKEVYYVGQPIAVIAAETPTAASIVKKQVRLDIKELDPVLTIEEALNCKQFHGLTREIKRGNFKKSWNNAEHRLEGMFFCKTKLFIKGGIFGNMG